MNIDSITNGVVIDHITAGSAMELYELLGLANLDCSVAIIKNVNSKKGSLLKIPYTVFSHQSEKTIK